MYKKRVDYCRRVGNVTLFQRHFSWLIQIMVALCAVLPAHYSLADEVAAKCSANVTLSSHAQCKVDDPASYGLAWAGSTAVLAASDATVRFVADSTKGYVCTGTLVSTAPQTNFTYVLTAAHCVADQNE